MSTSRINIAIIHGIGINTKGYADPLINGIRQQFNSEIQRILKTSKDFSDQLNFIPIVWDDIVAIKEASLEDIFQREFRKRKQNNILQIFIPLVVLGILYFIFKWSFIILAAILLIIYFAPKLVYMLRTTFAASFACDITSYNERATKKLILQRVNEGLSSLGSTQENLSIISHSLGTIIASDFVWEETRTGVKTADHITRTC